MLRGDVERRRYAVAHEHRKCVVDEVGCSVVERDDGVAGQVIAGNEPFDGEIEREDTTGRSGSPDTSAAIADSVTLWMTASGA